MGLITQRQWFQEAQISSEHEQGHYVENEEGSQHILDQDQETPTWLGKCGPFNIVWTAQLRNCHLWPYLYDPKLSGAGTDFPE